MSSDLVIVYHRQPYAEVEENDRTVLRENKSRNGIVPTLKKAGALDTTFKAWSAAVEASRDRTKRSRDAA